MTDNLNPTSPVSNTTIETASDGCETSPTSETVFTTPANLDEVIAQIASEFAIPEEQDEETATLTLPTAIKGLEGAGTVLSGTRRSIQALREAALLRILDHRSQIARHERRASEKYNTLFRAVNERRTAREQALTDIEATVQTLEAEYEAALTLQAEMVRIMPTITPELLRQAVGHLLAQVQKQPPNSEILETVADFATAVRALLEIWPLVDSTNLDNLASFFERAKETGAGLLANDFGGEARHYAQTAVLHSNALWAKVAGINNWLDEASALEARLREAKAHLQDQSGLAEAEAAEDDGLIQQAEAELLSRQAEFRIQRQVFEAGAEFDGIREVITALEELASVESLARLKELETTLQPYESILGEQIRRRRAEVKHRARELETEGWRQARDRAMYLQAQGNLEVPGDNVLIAWPKSRTNGEATPSGGPQVQVWNRQSDEQYKLVQVHRLEGHKWTVFHMQAPMMPLPQIAKTRDGSNVYRVSVSLTTAIENHLPGTRVETSMATALRAAVKESQTGKKAPTQPGKKPSSKLKLTPTSSRSQARAEAFATLANTEPEEESES